MSNPSRYSASGLLYSESSSSSSSSSSLEASYKSLAVLAKERTSPIPKALSAALNPLPSDTPPSSPANVFAVSLVKLREAEFPVPLGPKTSAPKPKASTSATTFPNPNATSLPAAAASAADIPASSAAVCAASAIDCTAWYPDSPADK